MCARPGGLVAKTCGRQSVAVAGPAPDAAAGAGEVLVDVGERRVAELADLAVGVAGDEEREKVALALGERGERRDGVVGLDDVVELARPAALFPDRQRL